MLTHNCRAGLPGGFARLDLRPSIRLNLPEANRTSDNTILQVAAEEQRVVITKDADFVDSFLLAHQPEKLLLISTGNITNIELETLLLSNFDAIIAALGSNDFVELTRTALIVHA